MFSSYVKPQKTVGSATETKIYGIINEFTGVNEAFAISGFSKKIMNNTDANGLFLLDRLVNLWYDNSVICWRFSYADESIMLRSLIAMLLRKGALFTLNNSTVSAFYHAKEFYSDLFEHPSMFYISASSIETTSRTYCSNLLVRAIRDRNHDFLNYAEHYFSTDELKILLISFFNSTFYTNNEIIVLDSYKKISTVVDDLCKSTVSEDVYSNLSLLEGDPLRPHLAHNQLTLALEDRDFFDIDDLLSPDCIQPCLHLMIHGNCSPLEFYIDSVCDKSSSIEKYDILTLILMVRKGVLFNQQAMTKLFGFIIGPFASEHLSLKYHLLSVLFDRYDAETKGVYDYRLGHESDVLSCLFKLSICSDSLFYSVLDSSSHYRRVVAKPVILSVFDFLCNNRSHNILRALIMRLNPDDLCLLLEHSSVIEHLNCFINRAEFHMALAIGDHSNLFKRYLCASEFFNSCRLDTGSTPLKQLSVMALLYQFSMPLIQNFLSKMSAITYRNLIMCCLRNSCNFDHEFFQYVFISPLIRLLPENDYRRLGHRLNVLSALSHYESPFFDRFIIDSVNDKDWLRLDSIVNHLSDDLTRINVLYLIYNHVFVKSEFVGYSDQDTAALKAIFSPYVELLISSPNTAFTTNPASIQFFLKFFTPNLNHLYSHIERDYINKLVMQDYKLASSVKYLEQLNAKLFIEQSNWRAVYVLYKQQLIKPGKLLSFFTPSHLVKLCALGSCPQLIHVLMNAAVAKEDTVNISCILRAAGTRFFSFKWLDSINHLSVKNDIYIDYDDIDSDRMIHESSDGFSLRSL